MGHILDAKEAVYMALAERLNKNPVGAPVNETLFEILHRLYTESEALVGSKLPLLPMTLDKIADITGKKEGELKKILEGMADKGLVLDLPGREGTRYMLAPMVVGFFEYVFMRVRDNLNMKELADLFEVYFHSPGVAEELAGKETRLMMALVYESLIPAAVETEVLTYERASEVIRRSGGGSLSLCPCRHAASHLGKACDAPMDVCMSLGNVSNWLVEKGMAKKATVDDLLRTLDRTEKHGLVHLCDNVLNNPTFICHCCGCCCKVLSTINMARKALVHPSNFIPEVLAGDCTGCGTCAESCQISAIEMTGSGNGAELPSINRELCLGCGVCASACPAGALAMARRPVIFTPPQTKKDQMIRIAREKGRI